MQADDLPQRPFDVVSADLCSVGGKVYMVYADRLSEYPLLNMWNRYPTTKQVMNVMQQYFSIFGKPIKFRSDGGFQFDSQDMRAFLGGYCVQHGQ